MNTKSVEQLTTPKKTENFLKLSLKRSLVLYF
jgi:hypothetical protein